MYERKKRRGNRPGLLPGLLPGHLPGHLPGRPFRQEEGNEEEEEERFRIRPGNKNGAAECEKVSRKNVIVIGDQALSRRCLGHRRTVLTIIIHVTIVINFRNKRKKKCRKIR